MKNFFEVEPNELEEKHEVDFSQFLAAEKYYLWQSLPMDIGWKHYTKAPECIYDFAKMLAVMARKAGHGVRDVLDSVQCHPVMVVGYGTPSALLHGIMWKSISNGTVCGLTFGQPIGAGDEVLSVVSFDGKEARGLAKKQ
jgi:hypothetical protein